MNPDYYFHNVVDDFVNGERVPFSLDPSDHNNILHVSAPAFAQIMEILTQVNAIRGSSSPVFYQHFREDESNKVSMSGYDVTQMENAIAESPLTCFHLYVRDLQNSIESIVADADYNDDMVDYFRRTFDYRWRLNSIPASDRISDGVQIRSKTGTTSVDAYTRVSAGSWPFTVAEIKDMVSYQGTDSGTATPVLGHMWILQSLLYSSPQTEVFYTDQQRTTFATRVRGAGELADESFWYNNNTQIRSFFNAGQWGKWSVIDGEWNSSNGSVKIDTSVYSSFPFDRDETVAAGFWNVTDQEGSLTGSILFEREAVALWARTSASDEFTPVVSNNGTNTLSHGVGGGSPLYGILRYGPGSILSFNLQGLGSPVCSFGTSNMEEYNFTDGPYKTGEGEMSNPNISMGINSIDIWARETDSTNYNGQDGLLGGQLKFLAIGTKSTTSESFNKDYTGDDMIVSSGGLSATSTDGYFTIVGGLGATAAGPTEAWRSQFADAWAIQAKNSVVTLESTITDLRLTYPTILTTSDV